MGILDRYIANHSKLYYDRSPEAKREEKAIRERQQIRKAFWAGESVRSMLDIYSGDIKYRRTNDGYEVAQFIPKQRPAQSVDRPFDDTIMWFDASEAVALVYRQPEDDDGEN